MASRFITGLDIGTSAVKAVVAECAGEKLIPRLFIKEPSLGVRRGAIIDIAELAPSVVRIISEVKKVNKDAHTNIFASIGTTQVRSQTSRGIVAVSRADSEIYQDDIDRVVKAAQAVQLGPNRNIIHTETREFIVDGTADIQDPLGLSGSRLEANTLIVDAFAPHVRAVMRVIESAGGEVSGLIFAPIATARVVLSKAQKNLGSLVLCIGSGTTGLAVFEENKLWCINQYPIGSSTISNDIAIGLKVPIELAEILKIEHGCAVAREIGAKETIELRHYLPDSKDVIPRRLLAEIIQSRLDELFELVMADLKSSGKIGHLAGGAIAVGSTTHMQGLCDLARQELKMTCQLGSALLDGWSMETSSDSALMFADPDYTTALGLVASAFDQEVKKPTHGWNQGLKKLKGLMSYFSP